MNKDKQLDDISIDHFNVANKNDKNNANLTLSTINIDNNNNNGNKMAGNITQLVLDIKNNEYSQTSLMGKLHLLFQICSEYIGNSVIFDMFLEFIMYYEPSNSKETKKSIQKKFEQLIEQKNKFYPDILFRILIYIILNPKLFSIKNDDIFNDSNYLKICDELDYNFTNTAFCLLIDKNLNFYLKKEFSYDTEKEKINKEIDFMKAIQSKFIVNLDKNKQKPRQSEIIIPYFPLGTLNSCIKKNINANANTNKTNFSNVDKIVIILEIASAFEDLHTNNLYHGNFCSQFVYLSSQKDAYIGNLFYDIHKEKEESRKVSGPFHFRSPENRKQIDEQTFSEDNDNYIQMQQMNDIYSFGIMMYELLCENSIDELTSGIKTRQKKIQIFMEDYSGYLFQNNKKYFDEKKADKYGDSLDGIINIIQKCIKQNQYERFNSFQSIIKSIKQMKIYLDNKNDIELRIKNASCASKYECKLFNLVESCLRCNKSTSDDIEAFFSCLKEECSIKDDIIKRIYEVFGIYSDEESPILFLDVFNYIIQNNITRSLHQNKLCDMNDQFFLLLNNLNHSFDSILPICTLGSFIKNNPKKYNQFSHVWAFWIAKDLLNIHSNDLYHGEISADSIGIYYNRKTHTLIPSIILFYPYYKRNKPKRIFDEDFIEKFQKKDIKQVIKIFKELDGFSEIVLKEIQKICSANLMVFKLYNFCLKNANDKLILNQIESFKDFSSLTITFYELKAIYELFQNNYSFKDLFIDYQSTLVCINTFLENIISNINDILNYNIPDFVIFSNETLNTNDINQLFKDINANNYKIIEIYDQLIAENPNVDLPYLSSISNKELLRKGSTIEVINDSKSKKESADIRIDNMPKKDVFRYIEFSGLSRISAGFLFKRYIHNLNPRFRYKITVKLNNQKYVPTQDKPISMKDINYFLRNENRKDKEPVSQDGNIIVFLKNLI